ncbi:MAG: alpha-glucosidase [Proteobacteria bacterium]|nr:MAG: alpha-glucosidase [Pseudomonadota bacterium]
MRRRRPPSGFAPLGPVLGHAATGPGCVDFDLGESIARVEVARDGSVRVRAATGRALPPDPSDALGREPWRASNAEPFALEPTGVALAFDGADGSARVEITDRTSFAVRIYERGGREIAHLHDFAFARSGEARVAIATAPGERFFGLGAKTGALDRRGRAFVLRNRDHPVQPGADPLYHSIPFLLRLVAPEGETPRADGFLLDGCAPSRFDVAASDRLRVVATIGAGAVDLTVFPGPAPADVLRRYAARTGHAQRPPLWALGHHQSRWGYRSAREVRRVAREARRRRIPTDAIHLDIDHMDAYRVFTWHPKRFPDPARLVRELGEAGFRVVPIVDPGVKVDEQWAVFRDGQANEVFVRHEDGSPFSLRVWPRDAALPDFHRAEVREWWGAQHAPLLDAGVAGIWNDMNEPAGWKRDVRIGRFILPLARQDLGDVRAADPADPKRRVLHETVRNVYGHLHCRATHEALVRHAPERRPFVLTRAAHAGTQRWAAIWTGDTFSTWEQLALSLRMVLGLSISGVPLCGADIGGFAGWCTPELFARWMQLGAFYPFARTHSMWLKRRQEPWRFGKRVESIARAALELRMRLLPYLYGLFCEAEASGAPIWRPLFWHHPGDARAAAIDDQFLVGRDLLVAPVLERGASVRDVYLPSGIWTALDDDARYVGPRTVRVAAPLERIPVFVRGGSVLPTRSPVRHVGETPDEPLVLEVYPGGDATLELVEDDGESIAYRRGEEARTPVRLRGRASGRLRLEVGPREGGFAVAPRIVRVAVHGCPPPSSVWVDAVRLAPGAVDEEVGASWSWEGGVLHVRWRDAGTSRSLEVDPAP